MIEKIRPLYDRVLVQRLEDEGKTPGGLYIPENAKEKAQTGKVLAVGIGRFTQDGKALPMQVKVGDVIFFGKYAGTDAGKDYIIIREEEILGVIEK
jgi:chaperonin GroES